MIKGMQEVIDVMTKAKADLDKNGGLKQVIFVACGGSFASSYPARFLLNQESSLRVQGYNSSEFVNATPKNVDKNTLVIGTSTKATAETVEALKVAKEKGAVTVGLSGYADSLTAQTADYYDAVLMDIQMPVMNGYDAARAIRQLTTPHAAVSIIAMTANAFEEDKQKAFAAGMDAYITKPVDVVSMMKTLHQIIETHRSDPDLSENKYL